MLEREGQYPGNGQHTTSYYAASANRAPKRPSVEGIVDTDICVIGAGFSGLSTALHLCEKGHQVTVVEGAQVGWGASGRNGGQIVNGLNAGLDRIEKRFGITKARQVGKLVQEGGNIIRDRISTYNIQCDLKEQNIFAAFTPKQLKELESKQTLWREHGMDDHALLDKTEIRNYVGSNIYLGGLLDKSGGHIHPLNLALGEAAAIESHGSKIFEHSRVTKVTPGNTVIVSTDHGEVHCKILVLCGNAYLGKTVPALTPRVMPVSTQVMATVPLAAAQAEEILPADCAVEDVRYILDYYRLSGDKRLLFGGGSVYGGTDPANIEAKLRPAMERVFPTLKGIGIDYAWSGNFALSFTRVPQLGKLDSNTYFAHGYSGHGVTGSHLFGKILSEAIDADLTRFDVFATLPWVPFPGGRALRAPYSTLGSWWYGLRDKIGV